MQRHSTSALATIFEFDSHFGRCKGIAQSTHDFSISILPQKGGTCLSESSLSLIFPIFYCIRVSSSPRPTPNKSAPSTRAETSSSREWPARGFMILTFSFYSSFYLFHILSLHGFLFRGMWLLPVSRY